MGDTRRARRLGASGPGRRGHRFRAVDGRPFIRGCWKAGATLRGFGVPIERQGSRPPLPVIRRPTRGPIDAIHDTTPPPANRRTRHPARVPCACAGRRGRGRGTVGRHRGAGQRWGYRAAALGRADCRGGNHARHAVQRRRTLPSAGGARRRTHPGVRPGRLCGRAAPGDGGPRSDHGGGHRANAGCGSTGRAHDSGSTAGIHAARRHRGCRAGHIRLLHRLQHRIVRPHRGERLPACRRGAAVHLLDRRGPGFVFERPPLHPVRRAAAR